MGATSRLQSGGEAVAEDGLRRKGRIWGVAYSSGGG